MVQAPGGGLLRSRLRAREECNDAVLTPAAAEAVVINELGASCLPMTLRPAVQLLGELNDGGPLIEVHGDDRPANATFTFAAFDPSA